MAMAVNGDYSPHRLLAPGPTGYEPGAGPGSPRPQNLPASDPCRKIYPQKPEITMRMCRQVKAEKR